MTHRSIRVPARRTALAAAALLLAAATLAPERASAQQPPSRIGNRWDSLSHQPTQGDIGAAEQERGLAPGTEHDRAISEELQRLDRQLLEQEQNDPAIAPRR